MYVRHGHATDTNIFDVTRAHATHNFHFLCSETVPKQQPIYRMTDVSQLFQAGATAFSDGILRNHALVGLFVC